MKPPCALWSWAGLLLVALAASDACAMTLRELRILEKSGKQGHDYAQYYLVGVMEGVLEAHAQAVRAGTRPVVCMAGRRLEPRMARGLLEAELTRNADVYEADMPVQLAMMNALATAYPC